MPWCRHVEPGTALAHDPRTTTDAGGVGPGAGHAAAPRPAPADLFARAPRMPQPADRRGVENLPPHGPVVEEPVCERRALRLGTGRPAGRQSPAIGARAGGGGRGRHAAGQTAGRGALEHAKHGREVRRRPHDGGPDMGCPWLAAPPGAHLQAFARPPVRGEARGRRRPLPRSTRQSLGAPRGWEVPDPGAGPDRRRAFR